jgi:8-oxo-dGTP pyrophosphatase MutT (NUDIX family)
VIEAVIEGVTDELVDYVDAYDRPVSRGPRGRAADQGLHYRVAATVCGDRQGRVLVYRRPGWVALFPDHHDVLVGGSVRAGESYLQAAERELAEELGIRHTPREIFRSRQNSPAGPCWLTVHLAEVDCRLRVDRREIAWCAFLPPERALDGTLRPFVPAGRAALERLVELHPGFRPGFRPEADRSARAVGRG